jgi:cystathionine gamma-synthase
MRAFGGMVSFRLLAGEEAAVRACGRTRLFTLGESLGGVESLIEHPARIWSTRTPFWSLGSLRGREDAL